MEANYFKLNDSKTEFVIFGTQIDLAKVSGWTVTVGNSEILPSKSARNIGAFMDSALNMETHVRERSLFMAGVGGVGGGGGGLAKSIGRKIKRPPLNNTQEKNRPPPMTLLEKFRPPPPHI